MTGAVRDWTRQWPPSIYRLDQTTTRMTINPVNCGLWVSFLCRGQELAEEHMGGNANCQRLRKQVPNLVRIRLR